MYNNVVIQIQCILEENNIVGLKGIQYILFILFIKIYVLKTNIIIKQSCDIIDIKNELTNSYGIFNFSINNEHCNIIHSLIEISSLCDITDLNDALKIVFMHYMNTENLSITKDYVKYYSNPLIIDWIIDLAKPKLTNDNFESIFVGNVKINSYFNNIITKCINNNSLSNFSNKIIGAQANEIMNDLIILDLFLKTNQNLSKTIINTNLLITDILNVNNLSTFDLILFDFPNDIHNVIHATCCQKIKKLKLRGTKAEPLLLQLVMTSLNKNGKALLVVPDSLLYSDSVKPIETRKFLLDNFNVKKVVHIDESLYFDNLITRNMTSQYSGMKNSILYFENNNKTQKVEFSKISLVNNNVVEEIIITINYETLKNNLYSLYYNHYLDTTNVNNTLLEYNYVHEIFDICEFNQLSPLQIINKKYFQIPKYYKQDLLEDITKDDVNSFYFIEKNTNIDGFFNYYLEFVIKNNWEKFTKGKMNQFDLTKIKNEKLPLIAKEKQKAICNYINISNKIIDSNKDKLVMYSELKDCLLKTIPLNKHITLDNIIKLYKTNHDKPMIGIIKNGQQAGTVYILLPQETPLNNSHYFDIINPNFKFDYVYQYLKHIENKIKSIANLTLQPSLNKSNLFSLEIPEITIKCQEDIIAYCNDFDNNIIKYQNDILQIKEKDILSIVIKLNNF